MEPKVSWYSLINIKNDLLRRSLLVLLFLPFLCIAIPFICVLAIRDLIRELKECSIECWRELNYYRRG